MLCAAVKLKFNFNNVKREFGRHLVYITSGLNFEWPTVIFVLSGVEIV